MKIRILLFFLFAVSSFTTARNGVIGKTVLLPVAEDQSLSLNIGHLYLSPQDDDPPLIAFYGEDQTHIFVYHVLEKKMTRFLLTLKSGSRDTSHASFVTFCWDQEDYGKFAVIFSTYGQRMAFFGDIDGRKELKNPHKLDVNTIGFNYRNESLLYILPGGRKAILPGGMFSPTSYRPGNRHQVITDYKLVQDSGTPYFVLRNEKTNDSGIYNDDDKALADSPDTDELYPQFSADGRALGYIERNKQNASATVCLKMNKNIIRSTFTFALDENALLREYPRMHFVDHTLYFFKKEPDLNSRSQKYGFFKLSPNGQQSNLSYKTAVISAGEPVVNILANTVATIKNIRSSPTVKHITPFKYTNKIYYAILTNQGQIQLEFNSGGGFKHRDSKNQAIVIDGPIKEKP